MRVECAWCGRLMGDKFGPDESVSHGICSTCLPRVTAEIESRTEVCPDHGRHFPAQSKLLPHGTIGMVCPECEAELLDDDGDGRKPTDLADSIEAAELRMADSPTLAEVNARRGAV